MVVHPDVDKIAFTGHVDTAKIIQKARRRHAEADARSSWAASSPNVIFADCDLEQAVAGAFHAIYFHGGQCCTAGSRLFVEEKIHQEFVERLAEKAKERKLGDPLDDGDRAGPAGVAGADGQDPRLRRARPEAGRDAADRRQALRRQGLLRRADDLRQRHATTWRSPRTRSSARWSACCRSRTYDEVIGRANNTYYGLAAAHLDEGHRQGAPATPSDVKAGTVWVNCYHVVDTTTPFGGFKMSARAARTARRRWSTTPS